MDKNKVIGIALILSGATSLLAGLICKNFLPPETGSMVAALLGLTGLLEIVMGLVFGFPRNRRN